MSQINKQPKFKIGDKVTLKTPSLYNERSGVITAVEKVYKDVNGTLCHRESDINSISIPYRFDGITLEIDYPETVFSNFTQHAYTKISKFYGYSYTVKTEKMNCIYSERGIIKL